MSDRAFVDTNVLVYLFDRSAPSKQARAQQILETDGVLGRLVISTQVLQEFYVSVTRKLARPLAEEDAEAAVRRLTLLAVVQLDTEMVLSAVTRSRSHRQSLWDALILEAAVAGGCKRLLSEDLQHGQELAGLRIENPFLAR
jgi:predicted nucleic acid-binding protein